MEFPLKVDRVVRSRRRTLSLHIRHDATVEVRAPLKASDRAILKFIVQHADWITRNQAAVKRKLRQAPPKQFAVGEQFLYIGKQYPLALAQQRAAVRWDGQQFTLRMGADGPKAFAEWYREAARAVLTERANLLSRAHGLPYGNLRVSSARTRWGSCSPENNLSFTWRVVMLPLPVIDYLVAHELAHTKHKNHGKRFWAQVAKISPDFAAHNRWLREHGHRISI